MTLKNIPCRGEQPPIHEFMSYLKHTYDVDSTFDSNGNWSFEGPEASIFNLTKDLFCLDGPAAKSWMGADIV